MSVWPAAQRLVVTVGNELWRHWDEDSTPTIEVAQTVPPMIADIAVPAVAEPAQQAIADAVQASERLRESAGAATGVLGHLSAVLVRADAVASSQIEEITTSAEALAVRLADLGSHHAGSYPVATELVAANVAAALSAHRSGDGISIGWFHRLHRSLLSQAHAQFETIHPYADGNGRVGRLLINKLLPASRAPAPVAHGLLSDPKAYIAGLSSYRAGDLDSWAAVFAAAISGGARAAARLVARLDGIRSDYHSRVRTRRGSAVPAVIDTLLDNPAITARAIATAFGLTAARASQILRILADARILQPSTLKAGRSRAWIAPDVIDAVDTINATAPRRPVH